MRRFVAATALVAILALRGVGVPVLAQSGDLPLCHGDCNFDGEVSVNEIILLVNIALDTAELTNCAALTEPPNISHVILAVVDTALSGCSAGPGGRTLVRSTAGSVGSNVGAAGGRRLGM